MSSRKTQKATARAAAADARNEAEHHRRRRVLLIVGAAAAALAVAAAIAIPVISRPTTPPPASTALPPWPTPSDPAAHARAAGLEISPMEGSVLHTHQHLSITVDGTPVTVPAGIGIDPDSGAMSALHTHDTSGILHVESAKAAIFTLGQLFTEWGIKLGPRKVGGYRDGSDDRHVTLFVNGEPSPTPLPELQLEDRQDIAIIITRGSTPPTAPPPFDWTAAP